jgi:hypothetical protein
MSTIPERQNEPALLEKLAAQRRLYSDAKSILATEIILSVPAVIVWSFLILPWPELKVWAAAWGIAISLADVTLLAPWQKKIKERAAKIQEAFDCEVLEIPWNRPKAGNPTDAESIFSASKRYRRHDPEYSQLKNWYATDINRVPNHFARLICQRASLRWDGEQRRQYSIGVLVLLLLLGTLLFIVNLLASAALKDLILSGVVPLMPAIILGIRQFAENREAAERIDHIKQEIETLWNSALSGTTDAGTLSQRCRELQDDIYDHRRQSPLIFDWVYNRLRASQEEEMARGSEALAEQVLRTGH